MRTSMLPSLRVLVPLTAVLATAGCGNLTSVDPEHLAGTWRAYTAVATNAADPAETADLIANDVSVTFIVEATGRVESIIAFMGSADSDFGTLQVFDDGEFTLTFDDVVSTGTVRRKFDQMTLDVVSGVDWDFGNDGFDEPATLFLAMQRDPQ